MRLCAKSRMSAEDLSARPAVKIKLCLLKSNRSYPLSAVPTVLWKRPLLGYAGMDCWKGMSSAAARVTYRDFQATSAIQTSLDIKRLDFARGCISMQNQLVKFTHPA